MGEIKGNDIYDESLVKAPLEISKSIDVLINKVEELVKVMKKAEGSISLADTTKKIKKENDNLLGSQKELQKIEKQILQTRSKLIASRSDEAKELAKLKVQQSERNKRLREEAKEARGLVGDYDKLNKRRTEAKKVLRDLIASQKASTEEIQKAQIAFDKLDESVREADDAVRDNTKKVGGYEDAIKSATEGNEAFSGSATNIIQNFISISNQEGGIKGFFRTFVQGIGAATKAGLRFILTPIGAIITAIVAGIAALTAIISRNQAAADKWNEIWEAGVAILDVVIDRVLKLFIAFGKLLTGDLKGAAQDASDAFSNMGDSIAEAAKRGIQIARLTAEVQRLNTSLKLTEAALEGQIRKFEILADDATRSFKEREQAAEEARKLNILLARERENVARKELQLVNEQVKQAIAAGKINRDLRDQQAEAIAKLVTSESNALAIELENEKTRRELKQDRLERDLDILIDGFDNIKTINDRIIEDDNRVLNERIDTFNKLTQLSDSSFNKQIETIKKFTKIAFDENELLAEQDAVILNERIRRLGLSEIIEGRLLEIIRERRIVLSEAADLERELTEAIKNENDIRELDSKLVESKITDNQLTELDKRIENYRESKQKEGEIDEEAEQRRREIIQQGIEGTTQLLTEFTNLRIEQIGQELTAVEFARNRELEQVAGNKRAEEQINAKFDAKRRELERKQLATQKASSLFNIAINTAVGITRAFSDAGPIAGIPLAALVATTGAIQAALVLSQQVPQFEKGAKSTPSKYIAGEGPELRKSKGKWSLVDKPTLFTGSPGDKIISVDETSDILGTIDDLKSPNLLSNVSYINERKQKRNSEIIDELKRSNRALIRTIKNKPTANISVHNKRTDITERIGNTHRNRLDAYYRGKV